MPWLQAAWLDKRERDKIAALERVEFLLHGSVVMEWGKASRLNLIQAIYLPCLQRALRKQFRAIAAREYSQPSH